MASSQQQPSCKARWKANKDDRVSDLQKIFNAYRNLEPPLFSHLPLPRGAAPLRGEARCCSRACDASHLVS
jgi:hypothetical protein